jgi:hypothetical protein
MVGCLNEDKPVTAAAAAESFARKDYLDCIVSN